ncbi:TonB-dependent receptor [Polymorphobacter fuscus]|uniref:TonB-dependent receptor n=1 Tax=Sandarakinorhabdus fusca TaxID=1439888 RepID=A0A7C9GPG6_9SPHN|nr:TonB-dependent receptor [Polymorphobacter fuscus]KAB7646314.1 TonB-dependent receptor [Polymorphobacter fuscus]MQT17537.1 TonB-dependent receptor [Polymorphobacter fuscus]NJC09921.1 outer membrane receptor protein involved in Fe transport [Polymorphobacter fuscus]
MRHVLLASAAVTSLLITAPLAAQTATQLADASDAIGDSNDIVVTAQKREQRISEVPITITAFSGATLRELGVTQFDQLAGFVPGLNIQEQSPNNPGFVIRGVTSDSGSSQGAPAVTVYLNGVDVSRSRGSYFDLYDLERIEVVKGPQATLFGTAAAVGAVSIITAKPEKTTSAALRAAYGNYNQRRVDGYFNLGGDVLSARLAFGVKLRDGVVENIAGRPGSQTPNGPVRDDLNGQGQYGARLSLRYDKDDLLIDLVGTYDGQRAPGTAFKSGTYAPTGGNTSPFTFAEVSGSPLSEAVLGGPEPELVRNVYDVNLTARYNLSDTTSITQIIGYRRFDSNEVFDADGTQAWFLEFAEDARGEQISSETRINYAGETLRAFAGFNVFHETGSQRVPFSSEEGTFLACATARTAAPAFPGLGCINAAGVVTASRATAIATGGRATVIPYSSEFKNSARITTYSTFADVTWIPVPSLELTAGARLLIEDRTSFFFARVPNAVLSGAALVPGQIDTKGETFEAQGDFQAFLPRANILWKATDFANLYATYSRGRRSPVVQLGARAGGLPNRTDVGAEIVTNYEAGVKFFSGPISGSVGAFYMKYKDFQVSLVRPGLPNLTVSAGSATNKGVEAEVAARVGSNLKLFANGAYIDARVDENPAYPTFSGDRFRLQSEWQGAAGGTLTVPLTPGIELFATPTVTYRSSVFFELPNNPVTSQGPVTLVNLRAGVQDPDGKWQLLGFATNLLNKDYVLDAGNTGGSFGIPTFIRGLPRLFGVEGLYRF